MDLKIYVRDPMISPDSKLYVEDDKPYLSCRIDVQVKRLGGGYGGKITRNNIVAAACGLAAKLLNR